MKLNNKIIIFLVLIGIGIVCYFLFHFIPDKKLEKHHKYTVATISGFDMPAEGAEMAEFHYWVNNKSYKSSFSLSPDDKGRYKEGMRLYVKFYPEDPSVIDLIFDKSVSDTTQVIPINGWDSIPNLIQY